MFEISGDDIAKLGDSDLRSLVAQLAIAELTANGHPRSSVTAGGHQDAPDGGIDVRVEYPSDFSAPDFVPRRQTGFQVKKPDMPPGEIRKEMRPKERLREEICELAEVSGSYVIVSSHGSVTDKPLRGRKKAMRDALRDLPNAAQLHTDFYDRDRLASWVNAYPGTAAWVRSKVGRPLAGWSSIGSWNGAGGKNPKPYLSNDNACLIDESSRRREHLTVTRGIELLRERLRKPQQCIRLIGMSGVGKTRLVEALFEEGVGEEPLKPSLALYIDYSEETVPTARDMANDLIANKQRAVLIVDNCNPTTHSKLASLCSNEESNVSLITIEYDVRDDEPEDTDVFRLQSASSELVAEWVKQEFPTISQVDRGRIAEFSDGNFRVAQAIAKTLGKGETLGHLRDRDLFERIFHQRNQPDQELLKAAEDLSLLYSIDGQDVSDEGELARVVALRGISARSLYEKLVEMRQRGVVQERGRFRAILPQAIANPLAARALERIPPALFDQVCHTMTPRMLKSVSRRLGFLHDSPAAQATVTRWLGKDGPLGDFMALGREGINIITNIAPAAPDAVLAKFEMDLAVSGVPYAAGRQECVQLIKSIGYDYHLFERAVMLLVRLIPKSDDDKESRCEAFNEFFHIHLSGTQATPEQRRGVIRQLAASRDAHLRRCAQIAMGELLQSRHFTSLSSHDFGARSRDWGWEPKFNKDIWEWFEEAIKLTVELAPEMKAREILAHSLRGLWHYPNCRNAIECAATIFTRTRPWIEGWIACRATLRYDSPKMSEDARSALKRLIERLKPSDLLNQARAVVINRLPGGGGWDFADGEDDGGSATKARQKADGMAVDAGFALAIDAPVRAEFLKELLEGSAQRAFECGRGLAKGADDLNAMWQELVTAYGAAALTTRNAATLAGFLRETHQRCQSSGSRMLEDAIHNLDLLPVLPYLQAGVGLSGEGIARLRRAIATGNMAASYFRSIGFGRVAEAPQSSVAELLEDIVVLPKGLLVALEILQMYLYCQERDGNVDQHPRLISVGRDLLNNIEFSRKSDSLDYSVHILVQTCFAGEDGRDAAEKLCAKIHSAIKSFEVSSYQLPYTLSALINAHPFAVLDTFLLKDSRTDIFVGDHFDKPPIETLDAAILEEWAARDSKVRYPLLGNCLSVFVGNSEYDIDLSPLFLSMLEKAPDKNLFLGQALHRLRPRSWSGSLADILIHRKAKLMRLTEHADEQIRTHVSEFMPRLDQWIERERENERESDRAEEESFE